MIICMALGRFLPTASETSGPIAPPAVAAWVSGGVATGYARLGETLTGTVTGGTAEQVIVPRWLADGVEIAGETAATLLIAASAGEAGTELRYAPLVDGNAVLSSPVQLVAAPQASLSGAINGEILPNQSLNGQVSGGYPGQMILHRWLADGVEVAGETAQALTPQPGVNLPAGALLRYAPLVDGAETFSEAVQLMAAPQAQVTGDTEGMVLPEQPLSGLVTGGLSAQVVVPGWTANDALLPGETDAALVPRPGDNVPGDALICYTPVVDGERIISPPVQLVQPGRAMVTGDMGGRVLAGGVLTGTIMGGLPGQVIVHRWLANGAEIAGADMPVLTVEIGPAVPPEAVLRYAPLLDGVETLSDPVQLVPAVQVSVSGDTSGELLVGQTLTGAVAGGLPGQIVQHRWLADGAEIAGAAAPTLTPQPGGPIAEGAELSYAPIVAGLAYATPEIALVAPARATLTGDTSGLVLPGQSLIGAVVEGLSAQSVTPRWLADGVEIAGETGATWLVTPGPGVAADAQLRYAPLVDGVETLSEPVQLAPLPAAEITGDTGGYLLPGATLTGGVTGGLPGQAVVHRWLADGAEIVGEDAISLTAQPGVNMPAEATLRYAPLVGGVETLSPEIQLVAAIAVGVSGDVAGEIEPEQTLTGTESGGLPGQNVSPRWLANGTQIAGESLQTFTPRPGVNVPAEAVLQYGPRIDGIRYVSEPVQLLAAPEAPPVQAQSLPRLSGPQRMGAEITLDASMLSGVSARTYFLNGVEIEGATGPTVIAMGMGALTCEVVANEGTFTTPPLHILHAHAAASHNAMDDAVLALVPHGAASHIAVSDGDWSAPSTWDVGTVPGPGAVVLVPRGRAVRYDVATSPRLDRLRVDGVLAWALDRSTDLLVETITVPPGGEMVIGDAVANRLPAQHSARITFSNRAYSLDLAAPTALDLARDPMLLGRGLLVQGALTIFGHHRTPFVKTTPGQLPMAGDTSCQLAQAPQNWEVGDTIIIPGTAVDLDSDGVNARYDEERAITAISGSEVFWAADAPLLYNHDHHNTKINTASEAGDSADTAATKLAVQAQLDALQLPIAIKERNVILTSEPGAAVHQRGHCMVMHMACRADIWDAAFLSLGRTDKSKSGGIIEDGQFRVIEKGTRNITFEPLTADANIQSRYPVHLHFCGFGKAFTDLVRDCYVEDAPGWAMVHHGCRADWLNNVIYRYQGSGMVSETGDELGRWDNNLVCGLETTTGTYRYPKGAEEQEGKIGDFGKWGYGFYYRGRAMVVTRNIAVGATWAHVFYHRDSANGIGDGINTLRVNSDVNDLTWLMRSTLNPTNPIDNTREIRRVDYPIIHFDKNQAIGCLGGVAVVKNAARQNHDLNIKISNFLAWSVWRGVILNYIGAYLVQDVVVISSDFDGQIRQAAPIENEGIGTGKSNQVAVDNILSVGFASGVNFSGNAVQGITNMQFSQDDPRFILGRNTFLDNVANVTYQDAGSDSTTTESVTRLLSAPVDRSAYPSVDCPFVIAEFTGNNALQNIAQVVKTDNVSGGGLIPKPWDGAGLPTENNAGTRIREILQDVGYWVHEGQPVVLVPLYFSDRVNALSIKQIHAVSCTGDVSAYLNNGTFTRSATNPVCADITRNVTAGVADAFNALEGATGAPGTTLSLDLPFFTNNAIFTDLPPAHIKPNYCKADVRADGQITLLPTANDYVGPDTMFVYVYDGQGRCCTVRININIAAA
jgi:hypothetical protein